MSVLCATVPAEPAHPQLTRLALSGAAEKAAGPVVVKVFCDQGESIAAALANAAEDLEIQVRGLCQENVEISRDHVALVGVDPATDGIQAVPDGDPRGSALRIREARRIRVENLRLTGGSFDGLRVMQSSDDLSVINTHLDGNGVRGATLISSIVTMDNVTVTGNGFVQHGGMGGVLAGGNSLLNCFHCTIVDNPAALENDGALALRGARINLVDSAVNARRGLVSEHGSVVTQNGGSLQSVVAAVADRDSAIDLVGLSFEGTFYAFAQSTVKLHAAKQSHAEFGNLALGGSSLYLESPDPAFGLPTFLVQSTLLGEFSTAIVSQGAEAQQLTCASGADAFCAAGATIAGSDCSSCQP